VTRDYIIQLILEKYVKEYAIRRRYGRSTLCVCARARVVCVCVAALVTCMLFAYMS